jgi:hypothetical protein
MKAHGFQKELDLGKKYQREFLEAEFENLRNKTPVVYNIETTNACNMTCKMCPRTTMMTRPIETIDRETFINSGKRQFGFSHRQTSRCNVQRAYHRSLSNSLSYTVL